jgi:hypothetical protein
VPGARTCAIVNGMSPILPPAAHLRPWFLATGGRP